MEIVEFKASWVLKFSVRLHRLRPEVDGQKAVRIGTELFGEFFKLDPEEAAGLYVQARPPVDQA